MAQQPQPWPGVQVFEIPSAAQSIASGATNNAGFIGVFDTLEIEIAVVNEKYDPTYRKSQNPAATNKYDLPDFALPAGAAPTNTAAGGAATPPPPAAAATGTGGKKGAAATQPGTSTPPPSETAPGTGGGNEPAMDLPADQPYRLRRVTLKAQPGEVVMCTNYSEFLAAFGEGIAIDRPEYRGQRRLAFAVQGFFANGGSVCFVVYVRSEAQINEIALPRFKAVDEIAILAAPGLTSKSVWDSLTAHCAEMKDRFAILDMDENPGGVINAETGNLSAADLKPGTEFVPSRDKNAAVYFPWIQVEDPALKVVDPDNYRNDKARIFISPTGHMAGVYARTDVERGVYKAPANTAVRGALGLRFKVSKEQQGILNPAGINCIRNINGGITVWGARTVGGDANGEWRYINVRRTFLSIMEDIEKGTQWIVFEPNTPDLWAKIVMNVSAYLTGRWRQGALFGLTPEQAFFVKCDFETNPPADRENGIVRTVIGVAIVRPAEFVLFEISQMAQQA
ncbi:MAG: phage tail sheath subtilisin-like domain-containing protein [Anaerolineae bacterium]|nr:phage tail sheath subtilisin-like domain-containing protein [Anaerolineae bacterium]